MKIYKVENEHTKFDNFLEKKVRYLKDKWNYVVIDDLAIIRLKKGV